jgi:dihydrofolate synthase/folylpolyglutamate synthase
VAVNGPKEVMEVITKRCKEKNNLLHIVEENDITDYKSDDEFQEFSYKKYKEVKINLKGKIQTVNASEVLETINILKKKGFKISEESIKKGFSKVTHRARLEVLRKSPLIVFDGGHNENAINSLKENIKKYYSHKEKKVYIISILNTKDYKTIIKNLCEDRNAIYIFTNGVNQNYVDNKKLAGEAEKYIDEKNIFEEELEEAINISREKYKEHLILIVGSFYVYKKTCEILK